MTDTLHTDQKTPKNLRTRYCFEQSSECFPDKVLWGTKSDADALVNELNARRKNDDPRWFTYEMEPCDTHQRSDCQLCYFGADDGDVEDEFSQHSAFECWSWFEIRRPNSNGYTFWGCEADADAYADALNQRFKIDIDCWFASEMEPCDTHHRSDCQTCISGDGNLTDTLSALLDN